MKKLSRLILLFFLDFEGPEKPFQTVYDSHFPFYSCAKSFWEISGKY